ncbi:tetratricopeptide repeat protein, partial [Christiangramia echinicola]|uniref:tetratricopeptide repeat protein n=1 Tax=Christiangramia echinicola TaxID=279359 RepID=UPI0005514060
ASRFTNSFAGGTLQYCSPEQIKGLPLKLNTDLWSFGAIAYEIFTGKALFQVEGSTSASAEWQNEVSKKILHEDYSAKLVQLPGNWPAVVAACLERDMNERVKDAEELLKILKGETSVEDSAATQILPQADNNATQIFSKEPAEEKREEIKTESGTKKAQVKKTPEENKPKKQDVKSTLPKPQSSNKKVWMGIAAGLITAVAVAYGFTYMNTSDSENRSSAEIAEMPVVFKKDSLFGYKSKGKIVVHPSFIMADGFIEGKAKVSTKDSTFFIDTKGDWAASYSDDKREEAIADNKNNKKEENKNEEKNNEEIVKKLSLAEQKSLFAKGKDLYDQQKYQQAYNSFLPAAETGYMEAQRYVGFQYHYGQGIKKHLRTAYKWYLKAVRQNDSESMNSIGLLYTKGGAFEYNKQKGFEWFKKSALAGNRNGLFNLGHSYFYGYGVEENKENALKYFNKSAEKGSAAAMFTLGEVYDRMAFTTGVEYDWEKARSWYEKASEKGHIEAQRNLGEFYVFGIGGVQKSLAKAKILFKIAADAGDEKSKIYLRVIEDAYNQKVSVKNITKESDLGSKIFINENILKPSNFDPIVSSKYTSGFTWKISYDLGETYKYLKIFAEDDKKDSFFHLNYTLPKGTHQRGEQSVTIWSTNNRYYNGRRVIGYVYYKCQFFDENDSYGSYYIVKVPAMVCWKPKRYY